MALGGTLLPSISTFASGPAVKSKPAGIASSVSSKRPVFRETLCEMGVRWGELRRAGEIFSARHCVITRGGRLAAQRSAAQRRALGRHRFAAARPVSAQQTRVGAAESKQPRWSVSTTIGFISWYRRGSLVGSVPEGVRSLLSDRELGLDTLFLEEFGSHSGSRPCCQHLNRLCSVYGGD